ncbi:hypothetical protein XENTR_v10024032 [Xenopus tropicalis]|nr:hypothetical protein XENTR_v10024032 [Xenopus tropicalis]
MSFSFTGEKVMGCCYTTTLSKSKNYSIESFEPTFVKIHEITDVLEPPVEFIATVEMPDHPAPLLGKCDHKETNMHL